MGSDLPIIESLRPRPLEYTLLLFLSCFLSASRFTFAVKGWRVHGSVGRDRAVEIDQPESKCSH